MKRSTFNTFYVYYVNTLSGSRKNIHLKKKRNISYFVFHKAKPIKIKCGWKNNIPQQYEMNMKWNISNIAIFWWNQFFKYYYIRDRKYRLVKFKILIISKKNCTYSSIFNQNPTSFWYIYALENNSLTFVFD